MVAITGTPSLSAIDPPRVVAATAALDRLRERPVPTGAQAEAIAHLDAARNELKDGPRKAAASKVTYLRNKLMAIKLAAGTASATGDLKFARHALQDIKSLTKDLTQALKDAGLLNGPATAGLPVPEDAAPDAQPDAAAVPKSGAPDDGGVADDAKGIVKELRKVMAKLRLSLVAAQFRGASSEEVKAVEKQLRETEKELQSLSSSLAAKGGGGVDLNA